jgi:hypothetical protein
MSTWRITLGPLLLAVSACNRGLLGNSPPADAASAPPDAGQPAPRAAIGLFSPQSTALVTTPTPTLRFRLAGGLSSATVEVCADRACRVVRWSSTVSSPAVRVPSELPPGAAFWRVRAPSVNGGEVSSPTWVFRVAHRKATADTSWLEGWDFNGDGIDDIPLGWFGAHAYGGAHVAHVAARTAALDGRPCTNDLSRPSCLGLGDLRPAGDLDGDGFADALARVSLDGAISAPDGSAVHVPAHVLLFRGGESSSPDPVATDVCADMAAVVPLGDVDGDGFADLAVRCADTWYVYRGSERGLLATKDSLRAPVIPALDVNADGLPDVLTGDGLRLGTPKGLGVALDVAPMPVTDVMGAVARADGTVDFVARRGDQLTRWRVVAGAASREEPWAGHRSLGGRGRDLLVPVGDVDGDGFDDLAEGQDRVGGWVRFLPGGPHAPTEPVLRWGGDYVVTFGTPSALGDVNGDGYDDLGVRVVNDVDAEEHVYLGGSRGVSARPAASWKVRGKP